MSFCKDFEKVITDWRAGSVGASAVGAQFRKIAQIIYQAGYPAAEMQVEFVKDLIITKAVHACWDAMNTQQQFSSRAYNYFVEVILLSFQETYNKSHKYLPKFKSSDIDIIE